MTLPPRLTDRSALQRHRARALRAPADAFFLHEDARDEMQERLATVNRTFTNAAVITPFAHLWQDVMPGAAILGDEDPLPLQDGTHDLVVHALGLHWADDPVGHMVQCRRALRPDGLFLGFMLGGQTLNELRSALAEAEAATTGGLSPRVLPMGDIRDLGNLMARAGFALPVADVLTRTVRYRDIFHLMADLRAMGEANAMTTRPRAFARRDLFLRAAKIYAQSFPMDGQGIKATFDIICLTGWAPSDTQPRALRPGSARARLADALNATERRLPDNPTDS